MDNYTFAAFHGICKNAISSEEWFVCLMERDRVYLGPWEGGTWGDDTRVEAWQSFPSEELARKAAKAVEELAKELSEASRREHGKQCLREMKWLEDRGLEADFLPEPTTTDYYVWVGQEIPEAQTALREYA